MNTGCPAHRPLDSNVQTIALPDTRCAAFLVLTVNDSAAGHSTVRSVLGATEDLTKDVLARIGRQPFTCTVAIGSRVWATLTDTSPPAELAPFKAIAGQTHTAVATPGDLLYHLRADSMDVIVEFQKILLTELGDAVTVADTTTGFRYFDGRDLLEFVDGTANPIGLDLPDSTLVGDEDADHAGGCYIVVQKYLHDLPAWRKEPLGTRQEIVGRTLFDNVELPDATEGQKSHKTLCTITDEDGEHDILRDNMPFATPGEGVYGTYFIGYSRRLWVIEKMLERMFLGDPPPLHDRILDFSHAVTGVTFFAPAPDFLAKIG